MNSTLLLLLLGFLMLVVLLNLWMTFRIILTVKYLRLGNDTQEQLPLGAILPDFTATKLSDNSITQTTDYRDYAKVWIFLSSACDKCKGKLPQLDRLRPHTHDAGVYMNILSEESPRLINGFLADTRLQGNTLLIDESTRKAMNPQGASPYYMFVDNQSILQAQGFIGDENWSIFVSQLNDSKNKQEAAA